MSQVDILVGRKLQLLRMSKKIPCDNIVELLDISLNEYKQFEFGEKRVPAEILLKICQMFEIKPVDIFADLGTKPH